MTVWMSAQQAPSRTIRSVALRLGRHARQKKAAKSSKPLPTLWFMTDPGRTPEPSALAFALPRGAAVIYRAFGARDQLERARELRRLTRARGLTLLIGADWRLAAAVGADGVHLPQRLMGLAPWLRRKRPGWLVTAAAHDQAAIVAGGRTRLDALIVSPVFPSRSPSAGRPLGVVRFAGQVRASRVPIIALGGVNDNTAMRLVSSGAAGLAGVEVFSRV
jgi:thiamine-phosphate pyrophosphorylase